MVAPLLLAIDARRAKLGADEFTKATDQAKRGATGAAQSVDKLDGSLDQLSAESQEIRQSLNAVVKALETLNRQGIETNRSLDRLDKGVDNVSKSVVGLTKNVGDVIATGFDKFDAAVTRSELESAELRKELGLTNNQLTKLSRESVSASQGLSQYETRASSAGKVTGLLASQVGLVITSFLSLYGARQVIGVPIEFEKALVGVVKTTDLAQDEVREFAKDIRELSSRIPVGTTRLLEIAQAAGQLGVRGRQNLLLYTETIANVGTATDLAGQEAATAFARILNASGEPVENVGRLAAAIVGLGNSSAATESEIAHTTTQVALASSVFKVTSADAAGLGATLASLGLRAELSGSAIGRTLRAIDTAIRGGGERLKALAQIAGVSEQALKDIFSRNAIDGLVLFVQGLGRLINEGGDAAKTLAAFGLEGEELLKVIPSLATRSDLLTRSLATSRKEFAANTALTNEASRAYDTVDAKLATLGNTFKAAVPTSFNSGLKSTIDTATSTIRILAGLEDQTDRTNTTAVVLARGLTILATAIAAIVVYRAITFLVSLASSIGSVTAALTLLEIAIRKNPLTFWLGLITAVGTALSFVFFPALDTAAEKVEHLNNKLLELDNKLPNFQRVQSEINRAIDTRNAQAQIDALLNKVKLLEDASVDARTKLRETPNALVSGIGQIEGIDGKKIAQQFVEDLRQGLQRGDTSAIQRFLDRAFIPGDENSRKTAAAVIERFRKSVSDPLSSEAQGFALEFNQTLAGFINVDKLPATTAIEVLENAIKSLKAEAANIKVPEIKGGVSDAELDKIEKAKAAFEQLFKTIEQERELIGKSEPERERIIRLREAERLAGEGQVANAKERIELYRKEIEANQALEERLRRWSQAAREQQNAADSLKEYLETLREETRLLTLSQDAREVDIAYRKAWALAWKAGFDEVESDAQALSAIFEVLEQQRLRLRQGQFVGPPAPEPDRREPDWKPPTVEIDESVESARQRLQELTDSLQFEREIVLRSNEEREKAIFLREAEKLAMQAQVGNIDQLLVKFEQEFDRLQQLRQLKETSEEFGRAGAQAFKDWAFGAKSAGDAVNELGRRISEALFDQLVTRNLINAISGGTSSFLGSLGLFGGANAKGNAFDRGTVVPFARGTIVDAPTYFPMSYGRTGLMGENGPEAIAPLTRTPDGELGIRQVGGGSRVVNNNWFISTPDADSFRKSKRQITRKAKQDFQ